MQEKLRSGFTIVELLIVVVVIAILAAIVIVAYNGIARQAAESSMKADLHTAATQLGVIQANTASYPSGSLPATIVPSEKNSFSYASGGAAYCLTVSSTRVSTVFYITHEGSINQGTCPVDIQTVTTATCPTSRTQVVDARDDRTYWIQLLGDGKCWMLTNLAYAGGGDAVNGDVVTLTEGTGLASNYTVAYYYIPPSGSNPTTTPIAPSISTDGTGQYGYFYNWCALFAGQTSTAACSNAATPLPNTSVTVCPAGWRLPTGGASGEYVALNNSVNGGATGNDQGLRQTWLGQYAGYWYGSYVNQGTTGLYWTSTQNSASNGTSLNYNDSYIGFANSTNKRNAYTVRCLAV